MSRMNRNFEGMLDVTELPAAVFVVDTKNEEIAVSEANRLGIPVVAIVDTNCDPDLCEVPIPCNDDAVRSVQLILGRLADAINEGRHGSNDQRGSDSEG